MWSAVVRFFSEKSCWEKSMAKAHPYGCYFSKSSIRKWS
jgi:hypothetical protein